MKQEVYCGECFRINTSGGIKEAELSRMNTQQSGAVTIKSSVNPI